jgi:hypothetical protein
LAIGPIPPDAKTFSPNLSGDANWIAEHAPDNDLAALMVVTWNGPPPKSITISRTDEDGRNLSTRGDFRIRPKPGRAFYHFPYDQIGADDPEPKGPLSRADHQLRQFPVTRAKFLDLNIEKIVLAAVIGATSLTVLYSYNLYSRAFESAGEQSRAFSGFALRTRDEILTAGAQLRSVLGATFYQVVDKNADPGVEIYARLAQLESAINVLANITSGSPTTPITKPFQSASTAAKAMRDKFETLVNAYDRSQKKLKGIDGFEKSLGAIDEFRGRFVLEFRREMAGAMATEFREFHQQYFDNVPPWGRPSACRSLRARHSCSRYRFMPCCRKLRKKRIHGLIWHHKKD